jgi:hypothetical protein
MRICPVLGDPEFVVGDPCPPERKEEHEELSAFEAATRELKAEQGRKTRTAPSPESERANANPWGSLPPARISQSSDGCIGYCFDAVLGAVDQTDSRVARVVIFDQKGRPTRALVERTRVREWGPEVRYTCFDQVMDGRVPRFIDCKQTGRSESAPTASRAADHDSDAGLRDWIGDGPFLD